MRELFHFTIVAGFIVVLSLSAVNSVYMLISPKAWFRLPRWLRASGSLAEEKYRSGWGVVNVRFAGALGLAITVCMLYAAFIRHR
jgi:hypothetical protein